MLRRLDKVNKLVVSCEVANKKLAIISLITAATISLGIFGLTRRHSRRSDWSADSGTHKARLDYAKGRHSLFLVRGNNCGAHLAGVIHPSAEYITRATKDFRWAYKKFNSEIFKFASAYNSSMSRLLATDTKSASAE